jgi:3-deoxy-D-manno-octulosonic-acid transferase
MLQVLYTLLLRLALPLVMLRLWWLGRADPALRVDLSDRLARRRTLRRGALPPVWIHAVSVGEVQAVAGLLRGLRARDPRRPLLLTMATATGHQRARSLYAAELAGTPDRAALRLRYAPFDLPGAVRRFIQQEQPCIALILETELWPNLLRACERAGVPVALVSARLSERSLRRYRSLAAGLMQRSLQRLTRIVVQGEADAARFLALGATSAQVAVGGNLKFDLQLPLDLPERAALLRARVPADRRVWVAGSTHAIEEQYLLQAQRLLQAGPLGAAVLLVMAPRHPERFEAVAAAVAREGLVLQRHSQGGPIAPDTQVLLVDTLGDLLAWYACAEMAFVGGSLVPVGGHNLLEPAALGVPVLSGPAQFNSPDAARLLTACGALQTVADASELSYALVGLFEDRSEAGRRGAAGKAVLAANRGAAQRSLALLEPLLPAVVQDGAAGSTAA